MKDDWHKLECRFLDLAKRAPELYLNFSPTGPTERGSKGWKCHGEWEWYISGDEGNLHVDELEQLILRAGLVLRGDSTVPLRYAASQFVATAIEQFGFAMTHSAPGLQEKNRPPVCCNDAAAVCAVTSSHFILVSFKVRLVTPADVASHLGIQRIEPSHIKDWPPPVIQKSGNRPAQYDWAALKPVLQKQRPNGRWEYF